MNKLIGWFSYFLIIIGITATITAIWLWQAVPVDAQCGTQASSCKNCHEVQGQLSVNKDGKPWHQSHAFGDFCANCHAGNVQSMVKEEAHQGLINPLSDIQGSCSSCHPNDLTERAQVYASLLGVEISSVKAASVESEQKSPTTEQQSVAQEETAVQEPPQAQAMVIQGEIIDYNQRYYETTQTKASINWGNIVLVILILAFLVGGGSFVVWNEKRLRQVSTPQIVTKEPSAAKEPAVQIEGISLEVAALLPQLSKMTPVGLRALQRILEHPEEASELLFSLSQLDADLIRKVQNLDPRARALLIALTSKD